MGCIEKNWPYFLGFGLPLSLLLDTLGGGDVLSTACAFSLLFPVFIVAGNEAHVAMNAENVAILVFYPTVAASNVVFSTFHGLVEGKSKSRQQH